MKKNNIIADFKWSLSADRFDSTAIFRELSAFLNGSENVFIEGTRISKEAEAIYKYNFIDIDYLPRKGTIWPVSKIFCCKGSVRFFQSMEKLSENHAEPELFDHFFIYNCHEPILEWWDAFFDPIILSSNILESDVNIFATKLNLSVNKQYI